LTTFQNDASSDEGYYSPGDSADHDEEGQKNEKDKEGYSDRPLDSNARGAKRNINGATSWKHWHYTASQPDLPVSKRQCRRPELPNLPSGYASIHNTPEWAKFLCGVFSDAGVLPDRPESNYRAPYVEDADEGEWYDKPRPAGLRRYRATRKPKPKRACKKGDKRVCLGKTPFGLVQKDTFVTPFFTAY